MTCSCSQPFAQCSFPPPCFRRCEISDDEEELLWDTDNCLRCPPGPTQDQGRGVSGHATKRRQSSSPGPNAPPKKPTWKRFLSMFQNKVKHKPSSLKQKRPSSAMLQECASLVRVVRRTAAECFAPAVAGGDEVDELPCYYMQLDQVSYGVRREAYGPIYLVT
ncbi:uncharacterized protein [Zea mays]|uniref:Uncharacterized protein n=1 Tax=Zea mays TaxID=4577 RepID=B6TMU6_MAIZE|nr:uncharacterized protein LOC100277026 [Zea mays]XP_023158215.1 uncharacterized protein LOC100277026 isoform X1 [Zea mays]XP_023158219.1 uncharacterized protein LOC100277026 isoform X1 [Zea mays]XP_023158221.1 uncharacterized protein LOC100277026 isoform X1 [Zea mays]XP_023158222.1 uncharacterized protein LOC100277026 isoform X1 [Zea mays]XP_023158223.1 uncharacterized protein LOC100277026 isoform X1 [Zea mays]XP_023158224.1 uncharacterized protein LOC100277026 isoform X1 [Zea mays]XP_02315|eukprot:NP_001144171.1 uncharacterized protein LOC100277026 [Zea mays]